MLALPVLPFHAVAAVSEDVRAGIAASLEKILGGEAIQGIESTPMADIYQVRLSGSRYLYVNGEGNYMIAGELYGLGGKELVNLTDKERSGIRRDSLQKMKVDEAIVFKPKGETKAILNVFTDIDCGYCRLFHKQVPELNSKGVEVRYLAFPRSGIGNESYLKLVSAWCADDPQQALTDLKNDKQVAAKYCDNNPVASDYQLGIDFGVQGTPSLVLMDGTMIPGYKPANELLDLLGIK